MIGKNSGSLGKRDQLITGVDIVNINRIKKILLKNKDQFYNRIFTREEIGYIEKKGHRATTVSGLFAAKEAVSKALGTGIGSLGWKDVEVLHKPSGRPYINFTEYGTKIMEDLGIIEIQISISHDTDYAIAFVVGYGPKV